MPIGEMGDHVTRYDFMGAEIPIASTAVVASGDHVGYKIGPFKVTGSLQDTDSGVTGTDIVGGAARLTSSASTDGDGIFVGTNVIYDVTLNGTLMLETRVQRASVAAGSVFIGFMNLNADEVKEPITSTGTTHTFISTPSLVGYVLDSQLTATATWHCVFAGGDTSNPTDSEQTVTGTSNARNTLGKAAVIAVAGEYDVLKVEIGTDGTARWFVNEDLMQTQLLSLSTTVDLAGGVGIWSTTTTVATMDVDYLIIKARRDWTR